MRGRIFCKEGNELYSFKANWSMLVCTLWSFNPKSLRLLWYNHCPRSPNTEGPGRIHTVIACDGSHLGQKHWGLFWLALSWKPPAQLNCVAQTGSSGVVGFVVIAVQQIVCPHFALWSPKLSLHPQLESVYQWPATCPMSKLIQPPEETAHIQHHWHPILNLRRMSLRLWSCHGSWIEKFPPNLLGNHRKELVMGKGWQ